MSIYSDSLKLIYGICMAEEMNETESQELFGWHVFRESYPDRNYVEYKK